MASVASQLIEEVTAHAQSDHLEDAREIYADGTYFLNNLHIFYHWVFKPQVTYNSVEPETSLPHSQQPATCP